MLKKLLRCVGSVLLGLLLFVAGCKTVAPISYRSENVPEIVNMTEEELYMVSIYDHSEKGTLIRISSDIIPARSSDCIHIGNNKKYFGFRLREFFIFRDTDILAQVQEKTVRIKRSQSSSFNYTYIDKSFLYTLMQDNKITSINDRELAAYTRQVHDPEQATCLLYKADGSIEAKNESDMPWYTDGERTLYYCKDSGVEYPTHLK